MAERNSWVVTKVKNQVATQIMSRAKLGFCAVVLALAGCGQDKPVAPSSEALAKLVPPTEASKGWYYAGQNKIAEKAQSVGPLAGKGKARNVILFVGDGMGVSTITAARIYAGQQLGKLGEEHELSFDTMPFAGLSRTYNTDQQTPDSAGTMTAMITGVKTRAGVLSISEDVVPNHCGSGKGHKLFTALELAELSGKATGIVTTARVTHATPGATYAKSAQRDWEDDSELSAEAKAAGCEDIAKQLITFEARLKSVASEQYVNNVNGIEVIMGGGRRHFLPRDSAFNTPDASKKIEGKRNDGANLIAEWQAQHPQGQVVFGKAAFDKLAPNAQSHVLALFSESHMRYGADRGADKLGEPTLAEMTDKAIDLLKQDQDGFFLMVEAGRIDHAHHEGNAYNALAETVELSDAVAVALEKTSAEDTLIIVTADHSHVFTMAGYPARGNPILGKVRTGSGKLILDENGLPFTTLGYHNGMGFANIVDGEGERGAINVGRHDISDIDTEHRGYHQEALVPLESETHGGEDVAIYASGPGAVLVSGSHEQNVIFHVMDYAAGLTQSAAKAVR